MAYNRIQATFVLHYGAWGFHKNRHNDNSNANKTVRTELLFIKFRHESYILPVLWVKYFKVPDLKKDLRKDNFFRDEIDKKLKKLNFGNQPHPFRKE